MISVFCCETRRGKAYRLFAVSFHMLWVIVVLCSLPVSCSGGCKLRNSGTGQERDDKYLKMLDPLKNFNFTVTEGSYTYKLAICNVVDDKTYPNGGVVQIQNTGTKKKNYSLGRIDEAEVKGGNDWVFLTYNNGSNYGGHCNQTYRTSHIMVICDPSVVTGELRILEERLFNDSDDCYYLFELSSSVVCNPKEPPHSLSSGSVFCIIAFTVIGIYVLLGFLYQRIVVGAKGLEQIPNYTFWRSFGNLQADGCDYICRCGPRQESQAYRGIDDRIRTDEERDDQLLNM